MSFLRSDFGSKHIDPIVKAVHEDKLAIFSDCSDFKIFSDVKTVAEQVTLLQHTDVFNPQ